MIYNISSIIKLWENAEARPNLKNAIEILKYATTAVPLKYLSNFWRLLEMPLINYKLETDTVFCFFLQLVMIMQMIMIIIVVLLSKAQNYMLIYHQGTIENYQNFLAKDLKD